MKRNSGFRAGRPVYDRNEGRMARMRRDGTVQLDLGSPCFGCNERCHEGNATRACAVEVSKYGNAAMSGCR